MRARAINHPAQELRTLRAACKVVAGINNLCFEQIKGKARCQVHWPHVLSRWLKQACEVGKELGAGSQLTPSGGG